MVVEQCGERVVLVLHGLQLLGPALARFEPLPGPVPTGAGGGGLLGGLGSRPVGGAGGVLQTGQRLLELLRTGAQPGVLRVRLEPTDGGAGLVQGRVELLQLQQPGLDGRRCGDLTHA